MLPPIPSPRARKRLAVERLEDRVELVTFAAGETSKAIRVATVGDAVADGGETFSLDLSSTTGGTAIDDGVAVAYSTADSTAYSWSDYQAASGTLTFASG